MDCRPPKVVCNILPQRIHIRQDGKDTDRQRLWYWEWQYGLEVAPERDSKIRHPTRCQTTQTHRIWKAADLAICRALDVGAKAPTELAAMHAAATSLIIEIFIDWYCVFMCQEEHCQTVYYEDVVSNARLDAMWGSVRWGTREHASNQAERQAFDGKTLN